MIGSRKEQLQDFNKIMTQLESYTCKATDFWNRKYFKLGFTYMIDICMPGDFVILEKEHYYKKVHDFLNSIRMKHLSEHQKTLLINFIENLDKGTEIQKKRFFMYYNLIQNTNKILNYSDIEKIENCSTSAIKASITSIISKLVNLTGNKKCLFLAIMKEIDI